MKIGSFTIFHDIYVSYPPQMNDKNFQRVIEMSFASVYPHYITKAEKKGRTKTEVDEIIFWLTGYNKSELEEIISIRTFLKTPQRSIQMQTK